MSEVFAGIEAALSFGSLIANVTGVSLGILFGAMPGLTAAMGVALLIPDVYKRQAQPYGVRAVAPAEALLYGSARLLRRADSFPL